MLSNIIHVREFGKEEETIDVGKLSSDLKGHGGGDSGIIQDFLEMLLNDAEPNERTTTLEHSMESHFIALAAEESRLHGGRWWTWKPLSSAKASISILLKNRKRAAAKPAAALCVLRLFPAGGYSGAVPGQTRSKTSEKGASP